MWQPVNQNKHINYEKKKKKKKNKEHQNIKNTPS